MEEGRVKNNRWLVILLCVFGVVIVGLTTGIVVVNMNNKNNNDNLDNLSVCKSEESVSNINTCINSLYDSNNNETIAVDEYNKAIVLFNEAGDYGKAANLIVDRSVFLVSKVHDCDKALNLFDEENIENMDANNKATVYTGAIGISIDCKNKEKEEKWNKLLTDIMSEMTGEGFI